MPFAFGDSKEGEVQREAPVKDRKKEYELQNPRYTFDNIVLGSQQKNEIRMALGFEKYRETLFGKWKMDSKFMDKKGLYINLYGESGTGKTMAAHAIANELDKSLLIVNYAEIESKYVGETSKNIVDVFDYAGKNEAVLLFDEADALLSKRVTNMSSSTDVSVNQTKSVLLNILNYYNGIVIFTTNFISNYDYAFIRRIPFQIKFGLPDENQRKELWKYYLDTEMPYKLDIDKISEKFNNVSGADISNAVITAALNALVDGSDMVSENYFYDAMDGIVRAKLENKGEGGSVVSRRVVSEEYALEQIKGGKTT